MESKSSLLKTSYTLDIDPEATDLELTRKPPPRGLAFMLPEGTIQASKRGKQPEMLPNYDVCEPRQQLVWLR